MTLEKCGDLGGERTRSVEGDSDRVIYLPGGVQREHSTCRKPTPPIVGHSKHFESIMFSISELVTNLALSVGILVISRFLWNYLRSPLRSFSGPVPTSFTNIWRLQDVFKGRCDITHNELHRKYGPAVRMGPNILSLSDPNLIGQVYNTKNPWLKVLCRSI